MIRRVIEKNIRYVVGGPGRVKRYIPEFAAAAGSYIQAASTTELPGDFSLSFKLQPLFDQFFVVGDSTTSISTGRLVVTTAGTELFGWGFNNTPMSSTSWTSDGLAHDIEISRSESTITFSVDGNSVATATTDDTLTFDRIGGKFGGTSGVPTISGRMFDLKCINNGTPIINSPLKDDLTTTHCRNLAAGGPILTYVNMTSADTERFTRFGSEWRNDDGSVVLEIAY